MIAKLQLFEPETVLGIQKKENWVASSLFFFFEESNLECWEKRKVKVTENCVENTDFAFAATSRSGHMPRQLPARLSGIRSIGVRVGCMPRSSASPKYRQLLCPVSLRGKHFDKPFFLPDQVCKRSWKSKPSHLCPNFHRNAPGTLCFKSIQEKVASL